MREDCLLEREGTRHGEGGRYGQGGRDGVGWRDGEGARGVEGGRVGREKVRMAQGVWRTGMGG